MFTFNTRRAAFCAVSPALLLALLSGCASNEAPATGSLAPSMIDGKCVTVLCDADMTATSLFDGQLPTGVAARDTLTTVVLPISDAPDLSAGKWTTQVGQAPVSNAAVGCSAALTVSADGNRAFVVESYKPAAAGQTMLDQLQQGTLLTAVDLSNPATPSVLATVDVGVRPLAIDLNSDGNLLAIACAAPGQEIVMVRTTDALPIGAKFAFPLVGFEGQQATPGTIAWHPSGRYFAVTIPRLDTVAFYEYRENGAAIGTPGIVPFGAPIKVGKYPYNGRFAKDGRHFVFTQLQWGLDVEGFMSGAPEGSVGVIRLSEAESAVAEDGQLNLDLVQHADLGAVQVGVSPESFAMSPTGDLLVTGNLKRSYFPQGDDRLTPGGSLSLLRLDQSTGALEVLSETPIKGMPKGVTFDATGKHLIVSEFRSFDPENTDGELAFFKVVGNDLKFCGFYVAVGSGPHAAVIAR